MNKERNAYTKSILKVRKFKSIQVRLYGNVYALDDGLLYKNTVDQGHIYVSYQRQNSRRQVGSRNEV